MRYYPVNLDIRGKRCLVVGGGGVGTRKARNLFRSGAAVTVVSMGFSDDLRKMAETRQITLEEREYRSSDLTGIFLVIGATSDPSLNKRIADDAAEKNMLCNIADLPRACNFILPSVVHRGDLTISISTSGKSPALARQLRKDLENRFGPEYSEFLLLMGEIRKKMLEESRDPDAHKALFRKLVQEDLLALVAENRVEEIDAMLFTVLGKGYRYEELTASTKD